MRKKATISEEVELKFELEPADLNRLLAHPLVTGGNANHAGTKLLRSTYFDTPNHDLRKAGVSLRVRSDRAARIQTIKAARSGGGIALARGEWEQEVSGDKPDFSVALGTALEPFLGLSDTIQPVFEVSAHRTLVELRTNSSVVEVVMDRAEIQTSGGGRPFAELEVELKEGDRAAVFQIAAQLSDTVPLRLSFLPNPPDQASFLESLSGCALIRLQTTDRPPLRDDPSPSATRGHEQYLQPTVLNSAERESPELNTGRPQ